MYSGDVVLAKNSQVFEACFRLSFEMIFFTYLHVSAILAFQHKTEEHSQN